MQRPEVDEHFLASVVPGFVRLVDKLRGGFKDVFIVETEENKIALKVCLLNQQCFNVQETLSLRKRLERECELLKKCNSDYVVKPGPIDGGVRVCNGQSLFIFSEEFIECPSLRQKLKERDLFDAEEALVFLKNMTSVVKHFKELGIIHKDIKPDNIFSCCSPKKFILTDLGIARVEGEANLTPTAVLAMTRGYVAPEYLNEETKNSIDFRADLFGIGVVCYELLTGRKPTDVTSYQSATDICDHVPELPKCLSRVIMRLLEYHPHLRYSRLYQLEADLTEAERVLNGGEC
jgi:serine/threonine protein kinase